MKRFEGIMSVLLVAHLGISVCAADDKAAPAPPKKGVVPAAPLSADPPNSYSQLPTLGPIAWETEKLPWVEDGPYAGISGVAMDVYNDKIVVAGGFIPGGDETDDRTSRKTSRWCWIYDTETGDWIRLSDAPDRREYGRGLVAGNTFYFFGGGKQYQKQDPPYRPHAECFALDLSRQPPVWRQHSQLNVPRTHMAVGRVGNFLVVAGGNEYNWSEKGYSHNTIRNTTEVFDLTQPELGWQTRSPIPAAGRGWSAAAATQDHLYVLGGVTWNESGDTVGVRETWCYSPQQDRWEKRTPPAVPNPLHNHCLCADFENRCSGNGLRIQHTFRSVESGHNRLPNICVGVNCPCDVLALVIGEKSEVERGAMRPEGQSRPVNRMQRTAQRCINIFEHPRKLLNSQGLYQDGTGCSRIAASAGADCPMRIDTPCVSRYLVLP